MRTAFGLKGNAQENPTTVVNRGRAMCSRQLRSFSIPCPAFAPRQKQAEKSAIEIDYSLWFHARVRATELAQDLRQKPAGADHTISEMVPGPMGRLLNKSFRCRAKRAIAGATGSHGTRTNRTNEARA